MLQGNIDRVLRVFWRPGRWQASSDTTLLKHLIVFSGLVISQNHHFLTQAPDKKLHSSFSAGPRGKGDFVCISMSYLVTGVGKWCKGLLALQERLGGGPKYCHWFRVRVSQKQYYFPVRFPDEVIFVCVEKMSWFGFFLLLPWLVFFLGRLNTESWVILEVSFEALTMV